MTAHGPGRATYLVTGIQAAGTSSVAQALAARLPAPAVHVHGDEFLRWAVGGRADTTADPSDAAVEQLDAGLRAGTPRIGLWLDTSDLTVEEILRRDEESLITDAGG